MLKRQFTFELGECDELPLAHFAFGFLCLFPFTWSKGVIGINHLLSLDHQSGGLLRDGHEITPAHPETFRDIPGNDDLTPLPDSSNPLAFGCFAGHAFRLSGYQKLSKRRRRSADRVNVPLLP